MGWVDGLRQLRFPREFRIAPPAHLPELIEAIKQLGEKPTASQPESGEELLASVSTGLWRLRRRMVDPKTNKPLDEMRRAYRHLEGVWDTLTQAGVEVQDHTGSFIPPGVSLKVVAAEPTPGLKRDTVTETVKPSVYLKGRRIQIGEVIVGTPMPAGTGAGGAAPPTTPSAS